jgi:outer membrane protein assembly factor BamB
MKRSTLIAEAVLLMLSAGCGGTNSSPVPAPSTIRAMATSEPTPSASPGVDDWTTFAHDQMRTGFEAQRTGITPSTVSKLKLRWTYHVSGGELASPIVANGSVYLFGTTGGLTALNTSSGQVLWQTQIDYDARMTPTLADGMLFAGAYDGGENFFAVSADTGQVLWGEWLPGWVRAEPVVANGIVYEGSSGGDLPFCSQGGVFAFDEKTGSVLWRWVVDPVPNDGGSVWAPLSWDGENLVFGTGNTCNVLQNTGDAVVSLTSQGQLRWEWDEHGNSTLDNDTGGGAMLSGGNVYVTNKNAYIYRLSEVSGATVWRNYMGSTMGYGGMGTPTTDGIVIIASAGAFDDSDTNPTPGGAIVGMRPDGSVIWTIHTKHPVYGYVAIGRGIAFAGLDNTLVALNPETGQRLWSYTASSVFYASPVLVPSGVYAVDTVGDAYAFSLP